MAKKGPAVTFVGSFATEAEAWQAVNRLTKTMLPAAMNKLRQLPGPVPVLSLCVREESAGAWYVEMVRR